MADLFQVRKRERRSFGLRISALGLLLALPLSFTTLASASTNSRAKIKVTGYGLLGDRELKRILTTIELGGKKPPFLTSDFIEDAALILTARAKRDGYLQPAISIQLRLEDGPLLKATSAGLLTNPLPRLLRITRAQFKIHKGILYHFDSLKFSGLEAIPEKQARSYFVATDILLNLRSARIYTPERLDHGVSSLADVLDREGYQDARVNVGRLAVDDKTGGVEARIDVKQGLKYMVHSVREELFFQGTNTFLAPLSNAPPAQARTVYPNKPSSKLWLQDFSINLKTNLYHRGYPDTTVEITTVSRSTNAPTLSGSNVPAQIYLDLLATVTSGPRIHIGAVSFRGEKRTRLSLMSRRVRVERGELLDRIKVEEGRVRLAQLGAFDSVDLSYEPVDEGTRDVIYTVKEGKALNVSLLFGWGSYELLRGGAEIEEFDIWGLAHRARLRAVQSFKASSGEFTYTVPEVVGKDLDLFINSTGLRREEPTFTRLEYGGGIGLHKFFRREATDATLRYNYQIYNALNLTAVQAIASEGLTNPAVGSVIADIKFDRRDNPLYPGAGYKIFGTIETATEYLGGQANFERVQLSPSWHHKLGGGLYLSLGVSHGADITFGSPANNLPFNERFFPGGENSIRGYQEERASPRNATNQIVGAESYVLGTVELEQALTPKWSLVAFSDNLGFAHRIAQYPFDTGLFSVGGGVRWRTLIGPIRLEYGYNLNPRKQDPTGTLQFSLGFPF